LTESTAAALRLGYRTDVGDGFLDGVTVGFGVERGPWRMNYALIFSEALGSLHRFEVGWRLGRPLAQELRQDALWREAREDVRANRWSAALEKLDALRAEAPGFGPARNLRRDVESRLRDILDPETLYQIGLSYLQKKDYEKAEDYFQKLLLARPEHVEGLAAMKTTRSALGVRRPVAAVPAGLADDKRRRSERALRRALEGRRWEEVLALAKGWNLRSGDPWFDALAEARRSLYEEAVRREERGDLDEAIRLYDVLRASGGYGDSAHRLNVLEEARRGLRRARSAGLYQEGVKAYAAGDAAKARGLFQEALALTPDDLAIRRALERLDVERRR
jgi:tetratricopeptide (TPR) repeat protein